MTGSGIPIDRANASPMSHSAWAWRRGADRSPISSTMPFTRRAIGAPRPTPVTTLRISWTGSSGSARPMTVPTLMSSPPPNCAASGAKAVQPRKRTSARTERIGLGAFRQTVDGRQTGRHDRRPDRLLTVEATGPISRRDECAKETGKPIPLTQDRPVWHDQTVRRRPTSSLGASARTRAGRTVVPLSGWRGVDVNGGQGAPAEAEAPSKIDEPCGSAMPPPCRARRWGSA